MCVCVEVECVCVCVGVSVEEEEITTRIVRESEQRLGIGVADGLGPSPYKREDEVFLCVEERDSVYVCGGGRGALRNRPPST